MEAKDIMIQLHRKGRRGRGVMAGGGESQCEAKLKKRKGWREGTGL